MTRFVRKATIFGLSGRLPEGRLEAWPSTRKSALHPYSNGRELLHAWLPTTSVVYDVHGDQEAAIRCNSKLIPRKRYLVRSSGRRTSEANIAIALFVCRRDTEEALTHVNRSVDVCGAGLWLGAS